jgi:hypothetical protein
LEFLEARDRVVDKVCLACDFGLCGRYQDCSLFSCDVFSYSSRRNGVMSACLFVCFVLPAVCVLCTASCLCTLYCQRSVYFVLPAVCVLCTASCLCTLYCQLSVYFVLSAVCVLCTVSCLCILYWQLFTLYCQQPVPKRVAVLVIVMNRI